MIQIAGRCGRGTNAYSVLVTLNQTHPPRARSRGGELVTADITAVAKFRRAFDAFDLYPVVTRAVCYLHMDFSSLSNVTRYLECGVSRTLVIALRRVVLCVQFSSVRRLPLPVFISLLCGDCINYNLSHYHQNPVHPWTSSTSSEGCQLRKGHLLYRCKLAWMRNGGLIPWNVTAICETFKTLSDGKTPYERRFGMPCNGFVKPFGAMVECHPISAKDQSRLYQFGSKSLARYISRFMQCTRVESGFETSWSQTLKNRRRWTRQNSTPEGSMQRKCQRRKEVETSYSRSHVEQYKSLGENGV